MSSPRSPGTPTYGLQGLLPMLQGIADAAVFPANRLVLQEHERLSTVLLILEGLVKVRSIQNDGTEEVLGILGGGECIGIASVFGAEHAWGDVASLTSVRLMRLPKAMVIDLIRRQPDAAFHFMAMMGATLGTVRERVLNRHRQPSERVLCTLSELARKAHPHADPAGPLLAPPISQTELAMLTGVARETCCRCLSKLQRRGAIIRSSDGWLLTPASVTATEALPAGGLQPTNRRSGPAPAGARGASPPNRSSPAAALPS
jgi:CRP-like cAMP-binding protein